MGFVIAVSVEWVAVHGAQRWTYTDRMPLLPGLEVGGVPVLQMLLLPPLIFRVVAVILIEGDAPAAGRRRQGHSAYFDLPQARGGTADAGCGRIPVFKPDRGQRCHTTRQWKRGIIAICSS